MSLSEKTTSKISFVIAAVCITVYIAAIAFGAFRIIDNIGERGKIAGREFEDLADKASSSAVFMGFMSESYQETIKDFINDSDTLLAVIITGSGGEYAFERNPGTGIVWAGNSPRFKARLGLLGEPFYLPLRIEGQRNGTIQATYNYIDNNFFLRILRNTLLAVLIGLSLAFLTLVAELAHKNRKTETAGGSPIKYGDSITEDDDKAEEEVSGEAPSFDALVSETKDSSYEDETDEGLPFDDMNFNADERNGEVSKTEEESRNEVNDLPSFDFFADMLPSESSNNPESANKEEDVHPEGLFTPRGNIGWASYTQDRLASELHRCASFEQDLVFISMEFRNGEGITDEQYRSFTDEAVNFFTMRDLIFEEGENGISVIITSIDLEQGIARTEEFRNRIITKLPDSFDARKELCAGLSSRSGRLIEAERLMKEAHTGLAKALADPFSPVVAFKTNLEKYRDFVKRGQA